MAWEIYVPERAGEKPASEVKAIAEKLFNRTFFTESAEWGDREFVEWVASRSGAADLLQSVGSYLAGLSVRYPALAEEAALLEANLQLFLDTAALCNISKAEELTPEVLRLLQVKVSSLLGLEPERPGFSESVHALDEAGHFDHADDPEFKCFTGFCWLIDRLGAVLETAAIEEKNREKDVRDRDAAALVRELGEYQEEYTALSLDVTNDESFEGRNLLSLVKALPKLNEMINDLENRSIPGEKESLLKASEAAEALRAQVSAAEEAVDSRSSELDSCSSALVAQIQKVTGARSLLEEANAGAEASLIDLNMEIGTQEYAIREMTERKNEAMAQLPEDLLSERQHYEEMEASILATDATGNEGDMRRVYTKLYEELNPKPEPKKGFFGKAKEDPGYISADRVLSDMVKNKPSALPEDILREALTGLRKEIALRKNALKVKDTAHMLPVYDAVNRELKEAEAVLREKLREKEALQDRLKELKEETELRESEMNECSSAADRARELLSAAEKELADLTAKARAAESESKKIAENVAAFEARCGFLSDFRGKTEAIRDRYLQLERKRTALLQRIRALQKKTPLANFPEDREERLNKRADAFIGRLDDRKGSHSDAPAYFSFCECLVAVREAEYDAKPDRLMELTQAALAFLQETGSREVPKLLQPRLRHVRLNLVHEVLNWSIETGTALAAVPRDALPGEMELLIRAFDPERDLPEFR